MSEPRHTGNRRYFRFHLHPPPRANSGVERSQPGKAGKPPTKSERAPPSAEPSSRRTWLRRTNEQKREPRRVRPTENRQRGKDRSLCKNCPDEAVNAQTRYPYCAEKNNRARQAQRKYAKPGAKLTIVGARRAPRRPRAIAYEITATSLRRKPESKACNLLDFRGEATGIGHWIPDFAGMTVVNWSICDSPARRPKK